jgi:hypothetical protein
MSLCCYFLSSFLPFQTTLSTLPHPPHQAKEDKSKRRRRRSSVGFLSMFGGKFSRSFPSQNQSIMAGEVSGENGHEIWYYIHYPKTFFLF